MVKRMKKLINNIKGEFTMKFTEASQTVISWVNRIKDGIKSFDDVPALFNLRKVVKAVLDKDKKNEE